MKKRIIIILLVLGTGSINGLAQFSLPTKLKLGQELPNLPLKATYNYKGKEQRLHDFKGKILILDFWATWCGPCIAAFPKMEQLRERYHDRLQILPITNDGEVQVRTLLQSIKKDNGINLFSVIEDTAIRSLFNFQTIPHYIIINQRGIYVGDAQADEINEKNINELLSGKDNIFSKKSTAIKKFDPAKTFFNLYVPVTINGDKQKEEVTYNSVFATSVLTKKIEGIGMPLIVNKGHVLMINVGIRNIFSNLFGVVLTGGRPYSGHFYFFPSNRTIWQVNDQKLLEYGDDYFDELIKKNDPNWRKILDEHRFSYEFRMADTLGRVNVAKLAINDLNNKLKSLLNLSAFTEKRKVKCLVLKRTSNVDKIAASKGMAKQTVNKLKSTFYNSEIRGQSFYSFMTKLVALDLQSIKTPIIDETGFTPEKIIDINLEAKMFDWRSVNSALTKYDLALEEAEREIDMVIITDSQLPFFYPVH